MRLKKIIEIISEVDSTEMEKNGKSRGMNIASRKLKNKEFMKLSALSLANVPLLVRTPNNLKR